MQIPRMAMLLRIAAAGCLATVPLLGDTQPKSATRLKAASARATTKEPVFKVGKSRLRVTRTDVKEWKKRHAYAFAEFEGTAVGATLNFTGEEISLRYAISYDDATKSDIALVCGERWINPSKLGMEEGGKMRVDTPGGFLQKDGRMGSLIGDSGKLTMTFFFDVPAECKGRKLTCTSISVTVTAVNMK